MHKISVVEPNDLLRFRFGKVLVPVPVTDPDNIQQFSKSKRIAQNIAFSISEAAYFPESCLSFLILRFFKITFYVGSESKSGSGTGYGTVRHSGSCSAKAKSYGSCSTTLQRRSFLLSPPQNFIQFRNYRSVLQAMKCHIPQG